MALSTGTRLGPYEIVAPIGAGGMGEVYRAKDSRLGREVAIKVLPADCSRDPERLRRFEQEARAAGVLNHPNITAVYDVGRYEDAPYAVQELFEGETLRSALASGAPPLRRAVDYAVQIAEGLAAAHEKDIVHRDVKPENLFVTKDGRIKILDFGLALSRPLDAAGREQTAVGQSPMAKNDVTEVPTADTPLTEPGMIIGTAGYMSPEQASGRPLDFRSDQFSFGAVLYELVTGRRAFQKPTAIETLAAILRDEPEPVGTLNPRAPAPLGWIVGRCLAKEPSERYASTRDLARDLQAVRERILDAAPATAPARVARLPSPRTGFVGRQRQRAAVRDLLLREGVRLVTLTGPGGIGKTRLAIRVAEETADAFPGGIHYVALAPLGDADAIASAICQTVGARREGNVPAIDALRRHLESSSAAPMLLILDGFEHLISSASVVAELVTAAPGLKLLVTSRSPLHVYGEHEFPVPPLALPDARTPLEQFSEVEAVGLFLQRASAVKPDFAVTAETAPAIAEICRRLDGLPLAIELAAARIKLLSPAAIRSRLEKRLQLLTGGARDLPARQQTLRGAIDWSHDLLSPAEQKLFRRLSVFVGGCTLEAVEAVCNAKNDLDSDALEAVGSIVDQSLLLQVESPDGEPRLSMLETIREYALERLAGSGDEDLTRRAHAAYCLVLAEEAASRDNGEEQPAWLARFELEHDNFLAALDWLTEAGNAEWGLRLGASLFRFWEVKEQFAEGREKLTRLLRLPAVGEPNKTRARALFAAGILAGTQGDYTNARSLIEECIEVDRAWDDKWNIAASLNALAVFALDQGDTAEARERLEENLAMWRELGDRAAVARSLSNLANVVKIQKDFATARSLYEESFRIFRELGDNTGMAWALDHQADVAREQGDLEAAASLYRESLATFRQFGDRWGIAGSLADLGNLARQRGDHRGAHAFYVESLRLFQELGHKRGIARVLESVARAAAEERQPERALRLAGAAAALRQALGAPLPRNDQDRLEESLRLARQALPETLSAAAWMEGWAMPENRAIALALAAEPG